MTRATFRWAQDLEAALRKLGVQGGRRYNAHSVRITVKRNPSLVHSHYLNVKLATQRGGTVLMTIGNGKNEVRGIPVNGIPEMLKALADYARGRADRARFHGRMWRTLERKLAVPELVQLTRAWEKGA
jgi:hypothetical protein